MSSAGQIVGGIAGALVGGLVGGPTGALYGAQIGLTLGGLADPPDLPTQVGPRLADLTWQSSTLGAVLPRGYGSYSVLGNVFWIKGNKIDEVVTYTTTGGKGSRGKSRVKTYSYYVTLAVGLGDVVHTGPIAAVRRIWIAEKLWYDASATDADTIAASAQAAEMFTLYTGDENQDPDPTIQADLGVANTPAWRGRAYLVMRDIPLREVGNTPAGLQIKVEVVTVGEQVSYDYTVHVSTSHLWVDIAWNESAQLFCAIAYGTDKYATSPDGQTWTERTLPATVTPSTITPSIASNGRIFVAILQSGDDGVYTSTDGLTWTQRNFETTSAANLYTHIEWTGSRFLVAGDVSYVQVSETGYAWRKQDGPEAAGAYTTAALAWNNDVVVLCTYTGKVYSSPTGLSGSWTLRFTAAGSDYVRSAVIGRQVIIPSYSGGYVLRSIDGKAWTEDAAPTLDPFLELCSDGRRYVNCAGSQYQISSDGITWTTTDTSGDGASSWSCLASNGGVIVGLAQSGVQALRILPTLAPQDVPLSDIVESECLLSGYLQVSDLLTSSLTDSVHGYRIGTLSSLRANLEPLQLAYPFDVRQSGYKIEFIRRPQSSVASIPASDLGAHADGAESTASFSESLEIDAQLARVMRVQYLDSEREYNVGTQVAERIETTARNETTVDLSLVLSATEAAGIAETLLYTQWIERHAVSFSIPSALYAALEPGDVVQVTTDNSVHSVRLTEIRYTSDDRLECSGKLHSAAHYTAVAQGASSLVTGPTVIYPLGPTWFLLLDLPRMHQVQDASGMLVVGYGSNEAWPGGSLLRSVDSGTTYQTVSELEPPSATIGIAMDALGPVDSRMLDAASVLHVSLISGDLESVSLALQFAGANHFAYGVDGRWEIMSARTAVLEADGSYTLSDMWRGRFGTEWAMGLHQAGDYLVFLSTNDVQFLALETSSIGQQRLYRAITYERTIDTDSDVSHTYAAVNFKPLAPVHLTGDRDPATGLWSFTFLPRPRYSGEWRDLVEVPTVETVEAYEIDVCSDSSYLTVIRTISVTSATFEYTSAQQAIDFGYDQTTVSLAIYQVSPLIGRGYPLYDTITRL